MLISSISNIKVKYLKSLFTKKGRLENKTFIVEGEKFVKEISDEFYVDSFYLSESFYENYGTKALDKEKVHILSDNVFKSVSETITPQGIIAVVEQKDYNISDIISKNGNPFIVMAEKLQDPGNMGALIRSADAFKADCVLISNDSCDIYNPKVIRATAGSIFHIPVIVCSFNEVIETLKTSDINIVGAFLKGAKSLEEVDFKKPTAILIGNEGNGLTEEIVEKVDITVKIPMGGMAESLNASVASGIFMYEISRQRGNSNLD